MRISFFLIMSALSMAAQPVVASAATSDADSSAPALQCPKRPTHAMPLAMTSDDYPLLSIAQGEQGTVVLDFEIQPDGSITDVKVAKSSGFARLDGAAVDAASQRWRFDPVLVDGKPISCRNRVGVVWKMEWTPEELAQAGLTVERLSASDFPPGSLSRHESGRTVVTAAVNPAGKILQAAAVQSSGFADLDARAVEYVRNARWPITPAQVSGKTVATSVGFVLVWQQ